MIQPDDFKYILIINEVEYTLPNAPTGWEESLLNWSRNSTYFGLLRTFSMPMIFVLDGAWLLRKEFYEKGLAAETEIRIEILNRKTWDYDILYIGSIDYSTFKDDKLNVEVSIMEGGISEQVKAYENVKYDIPLNEFNSFLIKIPGIGLVEKGTFIMPPQTLGYSTNHFGGGILALPSLNVVLNNLQTQYITLQTVEANGFFGQNQFIDSELWFIKGEADTNIRIQGSIKIIYNFVALNQRHFIQIRNEQNNIVAQLYNFIYSGENKVELAFSFDKNYNINLGEKLFLITGVMGPTGTQGSNIEILEADLTITNSLVTEDTTCRAMRPKVLFDELMTRMNNNNPIESQSFLLTSPNWSRLVVTCGDAIRQIPNPKIQTSFKDFFNSFNAVLNIGFSVENNKPVLEQKSYFMRLNAKAATLGEINSFTLEPAIDLIYNSIKIGYVDQNYETEFGRDEYNATQVWSTPITRIQKELNLISVYRADQLGIEDLRLTPIENNENKTDNSADNDVFMIKIQSTPVNNIYSVEGKENYHSVDGITGIEIRNSYYNLDITPKKNLIRHGSYIKSMLYNFESEYIKFESATKNEDLTTIDLTGKKVTENKALQISTLANALFIPYYVKIKVAAPKNIKTNLTKFPTGYISFMYRGFKYTGFIMEVTVDVNRNSLREYTLLLAPNNNVLNLIH